MEALPLVLVHAPQALQNDCKGGALLGVVLPAIVDELPIRLWHVRAVQRWLLPREHLVHDLQPAVQGAHAGITWHVFRILPIMMRSMIHDTQLLGPGYIILGANTCFIMHHTHSHDSPLGDVTGSQLPSCHRGPMLVLWNGDVKVRFHRPWPVMVSAGARCYDRLDSHSIGVPKALVA